MPRRIRQAQFFELLDKLKGSRNWKKNRVLAITIITVAGFIFPGLDYLVFMCRRKPGFTDSIHKTFDVPAGYASGQTPLKSRNPVFPYHTEGVQAMRPVDSVVFA
jgi:hypothetical protein